MDMQDRGSEALKEENPFEKKEDLGIMRVQ